VILQRILAGDHVATSFHDDDGFAARTLSFVQSGLAADARVMVFPAADRSAAVDAYLTEADPTLVGPRSDGRLQILDSGQVQLAGGSFDAERLRRAYGGATRQAVGDGYSGLWASVDMSWAAPGVVDTDALLRFEAAANALFGSGRLTAICQYDERVFGGEDIRRALRSHAHNASGSAFRHHSTDDFTFLAAFGEADLSNREAWAAVLESIAGRDAVVDITAMTFLDVGALTALGVAAQARQWLTLIATPTQTRQLRLVCGRDLDHVSIEER
jgi:hypothetical protein